MPLSESHWQDPDPLNKISRTIELPAAVTPYTGEMSSHVKQNPDGMGAFTFFMVG